MNPDLHPPPLAASGPGAWKPGAPGLPPAPAPRGFAPFPAPEAVKPWTPNDEHILKGLRIQVAHLEAQRDHAGRVLKDALRKALPHPEDGEIDQITEQLAHHADAIRDALAPFDSGVRQANG